MITIKAMFADGDSLVTRINATEQEAREYYVGKVFNVGTGAHDNIQRCTDVEIIAE